MGFGERKTRAKGYKEQTDKAVKEIKQPGLFSGKTIESALTFECLHEPLEAKIKIGARVRIIDMRDRIEVYIGLVSVGYVIAAESFRGSVKLSENSGMAIGGRIIEMSDLGPTFIIVVPLKK